MAARQTFVVDSRLPTSENTSTDDPAHPKNVVRSALIIQNQATADTKYDIYPPPRVEGFAISNLHMDTVITCVSILAIFIILAILINIKHTVYRIVLIAASIISIHYAVGRLEKRTV